MTGSPAVLLSAAAAVAFLLATALSLFFGGLGSRAHWRTLAGAGFGAFVLAALSWVAYGADVFVACFQGMVASAAVVTVLSIALRGGRTRGHVVFALVWVVAVLVPIGHALFDIERGFLVTRFGTLDFAGAAVLAVCTGTAALSFAVIDRSAGARAEVPLERPLWLLVVSGALGGGGLVALALGSELVFDATSGVILVNLLWSMAAGTVGWTAAQLVNVRRPTVAGYVAGLFAGGIVALAGAPWLDAVSAVVLGLAAGMLGHVSAVASRRAGAGVWATAIGVMLVPGVLSILLLGVVATGSGLIFSGRTALVVSQASGLIMVLAYSFAASLLLAHVVQRTLGLYMVAADAEVQPRPAVRR